MREQTPRNPVQWLLIGIVLLYAITLLVAPVIAVIGGAFEEGIGHVIESVTSPEALIALRLTMMIAITATLINTVFGVLISWVLVRYRFPGREFFNAIVDMPFVISPVIVGYVVIVLFGRTGWLKDFPIQLAFSWQGMLLVTVFVCLPFVIREVMPILASLTQEQEEAAYTLGASRWRTFWRIVFPAIRHGIIYGIVLTFARAVGEFGAAAVIGGGVQGVTETATIYIYRTLADRNDVGAYSMAIVLGLLAVIILVSMNYLRHGLEKKSDVNHS
jgi:sulfate/thiosulfate transport system permease protein